MKKLFLLIFLFSGQAIAQLNVPLVIHQTVDPSGSCPGWQLWVNDTTPSIWFCGNNVWVKITSGAVVGTVTSFSAGNFSPLFTTSVATASTTPALSFVAISQSQNLVFASPNGASGNPTFRALVNADFPTSGVSAGSCGDTTHSCSLTVNAQGIITVQSNNVIAGGIGGSGTTNFVPLYTPNGTTLGNSHIDDGSTVTTTITTTENFNLSGSIGILRTFTNDTVTGTTTGQGVEISAGKVINATASSQNVFGVCVSGCGTSGSSQILLFGVGTLVFDAGVTQDDYVKPSSTGGKFTDAGSTFPTNVEVVGRVLSPTNGATGSYLVDFMLGDVFAPGAGKGKGGVTGSGAINEIASWTGSSSITGTSGLSVDTSNIRIGIGTNAPSYEIDVEKTTASAVNVIVQNNGTGNVSIQDQCNTAGCLGTIQANGIGTSVGGNARLLAINTSGNSYSTSIVQGQSSVAHQYWRVNDPNHNNHDVLLENLSSTLGGGNEVYEEDGAQIAFLGGINNSVGGNQDANVPVTVWCCLANNVPGLEIYFNASGTASEPSFRIINAGASTLASAITLGGTTNSNQFRMGTDLGLTNALNWYVASTGLGSATTIGDIFINNAHQLSVGNCGSGTVPAVSNDFGICHGGNSSPTKLSWNNYLLSNYNGGATAGSGQPWIIYSDTQTAQVAAIADKTMVTVGATTSMYRFTGTVNCTTTSAGATATLNLKYTDSGSTAQVVSVTDTCTALVTTGIPNLVVALRAKNGTTITYGVTIANTPTYDVEARLEPLSTTF